MGMKDATPLLLLAGGYLVYQHYHKHAQQQHFLAGLRVQITNAGVTSGKFLITFNFQNPNSEPAVVKSFFGEVWLNGTKVGLVKKTETTVIAPNAETKMPLVVKMNVVRALASLLDLTKGIVNAQLRVTGTVNLNEKAQPVDIKYQLN